MATLEQYEVFAWLFTAGDAPDAWLWTAPTKSMLVWRTGLGQVQELQFSPDGRYIAWLGTRVAASGRVTVADMGGTVSVLDAATGGILWTVQHASAVTRMSFHADQPWLITHSDAVRVYDAATGRQQADVQIEEPSATLGVGAVTQTRGRIPNPAGTCVLDLSQQTGGVERVAQTAWIRQVEDGAVRSTLHYDGAASGAAWSPDGERLATGHVDGTVRIWNAGDGHLLMRHRQHGPGTGIRSVGPVPGNRRLRRPGVPGFGCRPRNSQRPRPRG